MKKFLPLAEATRPFLLILIMKPMWSPHVIMACETKNNVNSRLIFFVPSYKFDQVIRYISSPRKKAFWVLYYRTLTYLRTILSPISYFLDKLFMLGLWRTLHDSKDSSMSFIYLFLYFNHLTY